jgi:hypothetical protein
MTLLSRGALVVALLAMACGGGGGSGANKPGATGGNTGAGGAPAPGQEAGTPPIRGNVGGAFGGGSDPDAGGSPQEDAAPVSGDGPTASVDTARAADRPRDTSATPADAITQTDTGPVPPDASDSDPCATGGVCAMHEQAYTAALARARVCNPTLKLQCQMTSNSGLRCPGCKLWVTSNVELNDIRAKWTAAGCQVCVKQCPAIACRAITTGVCHSKMLAAPEESGAAPPPGDRIIIPPMNTGTCIDQSDPVLF